MEHPRAYLLQRLYMVYHDLFVQKHWGFAAQLTFNTMMAIIPVFAIIFAVGRGFGFEESIANWCREVFASQPQVAEAIVQLSTSYIHYTIRALSSASDCCL
jgi:membrane protein